MIDAKKYRDEVIEECAAFIELLANACPLSEYKKTAENIVSNLRRLKSKD